MLLHVGPSMYSIFSYNVAVAMKIGNKWLLSVAWQPSINHSESKVLVIPITFYINLLLFSPHFCNFFHGFIIYYKANCIIKV